MTDQQLYCDGPGRDPGTECGLEVAGHGGGKSGTPKCSTHLKQLSRTGKMMPITEKLTPLGKLIEASNRLAAADSDEDYELAVRAAITAGVGLGDKERRDLIRKAMAEARARGVRLGRPVVADGDEAARLYLLLGRVEQVAGVMRVSVRTIYRVLSQRGILAKRPNPSSPRPERRSP